MQGYFTPKGNSTDLKINSVKKYIANTDCKHLKMDISTLNPIEASKIAVLSSTNHYLKYPKGILDCVVKSKNIIDLIKPLILGNVRFQVKV